MTDEVKPCDCWRAPSETGDTCAAAWLNRHDRVAVTVRDGWRVEGRPDGTVWVRSDDAWEVGFQITQDDGAGFCVPLASIERLTVRKAIDSMHVVDALVHALAKPGCGAVGTPAEIGADAQEGYHLEVSVAVVETPVTAPPA